MTKRKIKKLLIRRAGLQEKLCFYVDVAEKVKANKRGIPYAWLDEISDFKQEIAEIDKELELGGYKEDG